MARNAETVLVCRWWPWGFVEGVQANAGGGGMGVNRDILGMIKTFAALLLLAALREPRVLSDKCCDACAVTPPPPPLPSPRPITIEPKEPACKQGKGAFGTR